MTSSKITFDLKNTSVETQKNYFMCIISRSVYKNNDKLIFDQNLLLNDNDGKILLNYKPLINKVEKLVEMINIDNSLLNKDIETELWDLV